MGQLKWSHHKFFGANTAFIIPFSSLKTDEDIKLLTEWFCSKIQGSNTFNLISLSVSMSELRNLRQQIKAYLPQSPGSWKWHVDIQRGNFEPAIPNITNGKMQQTVTFNDRILSYTIPTPNFVNRIDKSRRWAVEIDLSSKVKGSQGFLPSMFRDLLWPTPAKIE